MIFLQQQQQYSTFSCVLRQDTWKAIFVFEISWGSVVQH